MAKFQWTSVSKRVPCPICKEPSWCSISADGTIAKCMRVGNGCFRSKVDKNGTPFHLHRLAYDVRPDATRQQPSPSVKRADADTLHQIYLALLTRLTMNTSHREGLKRRGLSDDSIVQNAYRSLPSQGRPRIAESLRKQLGDKLLGVPGFVIKEGKAGRYMTIRGPAGLVIPCRDRLGRIVALKVRRDEAHDGGPRYTYISSNGYGGPGPGSPIHVPVGTPLTPEIVRITEGELKADVICALTGLPTLSIPGVTNWRPALTELAALGCKSVRLAFDADCWDKVQVAEALSNFHTSLAQSDLAVELECWNASDGKGLDDLLASGKAPELLRGDAVSRAVNDILASASADQQAGRPDELDRVHEVLNTGGAEALFADKPLLEALARLSIADPALFASVRASMGDRVSLRDFDRVINIFRRQSASEKNDAIPTYFEKNGSIFHNVQTRDGYLPIALCNFTARIVEEVVYDDGAEEKKRLAIEGQLSDGTPLALVVVPTADFASMNWVLPAWGTGAVINAGHGVRDHLRAALQTLSGRVPRRTIYEHTGWRNINGQHYYLHAGGAIGKDGAVESIPVLLPPALAGFSLPPPPPLLELQGAVQASLRILSFGHDRLTIPLLGAIYRAALGGTDFSCHTAGPSGSFKSEEAALGQQHFGSSMDRLNLPANWASTATALENLAFTAKDAFLVVDDFCPNGQMNEIQKLHHTADRLLRGQGNHSGRLRCKADASLRPSKAPRGLIWSTGEDTPKGHSLRARLFVRDIAHGDLGPQPPAPNSKLTACQKDAAAGKYAASMAGFIQSIAHDYEVIRGRIPAEVAELREQFRSSGQHARTPGIAANLALGWRYFLSFANSIGAITDTERDELLQRGWKAFAEIARAQADQHADAEPATKFVRLLIAVLASGKAHLADDEGNAPRDPERWGWRSEEYRSRDGMETRDRAQGERIGWIADDQVFLEPEASYAAVQQFARDQGDSFPILPMTLRRRLKEKNLLASTDVARNKIPIRQTLQGERRDVLHLDWANCIALSETGPTGPIGPDEASPVKNAPEPGNTDRGDNGHSAQENLTKTQENAALGRLGRSDTGSNGNHGGNNRSQQQPSDWGEWK